MIDRRDAVAVAVLVAGTFAFGWVHVAAGLSFPVPWPDEAHFLWPARSLATAGTFAAPELHPDRALRWMPPGYAAVMGSVFAVTGPSLVVARHVSALCVLVAAGMLASLSRDRLVGGIAAALWLVTPSVIAIGNVARMEGLVLALVLAGFVAIARDRGPLGVGALVLASAVHPNGIVFLVAAVVRGVLTKARMRPRDRTERIVLAMAVALAAAAWLFTLAGDGALDDLRFQLARKADRDLLAPWLDRRTLVALVLVATMFVADGRRDRGLLVAAALGALVVRNVGREMWYACFDPLFYVLAGFALLDAASRRGRAVMLAVVVALAAIAWPERPRLPADLTWRGMTLHAEPYVTSAELDVITAALPRDAAIEVLPHGDAALFLDRDTPTLVDPVRHPFAPDATLVHISDHQPQHVQTELGDRLDATEAAYPIADGWWLL